MNQEQMKWRAIPMEMGINRQRQVTYQPVTIITQRIKFTKIMMPIMVPILAGMMTKIMDMKLKIIK
jgi:hypothetical protein